VLPGLHPNALLDPVTGDCEPPYRNGAVELKTLDGQVPLGSYRTARPSICEKRIAFIPDDQLGIRFGQHEGAAKGRVYGRDQQAVIPSGQRQGEGARGIGTAAISNPPLATLGGR
jgi:hypothetical protein